MACVIWREGGTAYGLFFFVPEESSAVLGAQIDDPMDGSLFRYLNQSQLKSLITALINYEADLDAAKEKT